MKYLKDIWDALCANQDESTLCKKQYRVLEALVDQLNDVTTQLNQLRTDYNAETNADHTDTTATAVTQLIDIEP